MTTVHRLSLVALLVVLTIAGCKDNQASPAAKQYPIKGKVVAVDAAKPSVKLDHEEVPGLMKAMEMEYTVENAKTLAGIKVGDLVQGHLKAESGKYVITDLEKR
jgi:protein SCO1/2